MYVYVNHYHAITHVNKYVITFLAKNRSDSKAGAKESWFAKFPKDVVRCEKLTDGDENILEKDPYVERKEEPINYKAIFGDQTEKPQKSAGAKRKAGQ